MVMIIDDHIAKIKDYSEMDERTIAIWIRQRNKLAKDADIEPIPLGHKDGQGKIIYVED